MKLTLSFFLLLFFFCIYGQDSTNQKHPLFKLSGVSLIGGTSLIDFNNNSSQNISKQSLQNVWSPFATKVFYNYPQIKENYYNNNGGNMFGAYLSFNNYSKKKNRYNIHSQTNIGIGLCKQASMYANFYSTKTSAKDTFHIQSVPYYGDTVNTGTAYIYYKSTHVGLDVQQVFCTNQEKRFSYFAGIGANINFSVASQILYIQKQQVLISGTNSYSYQNEQYLNSYYTANNYGVDKIKSSILYQVYIPFGFNIRFGNDDKSAWSHLYFITQLRFGYEILKLQTINAFVFNTSYATFGVKYRF